MTGSNGKTTTKELIRDVLREAMDVHATKGNLNNHIGVPLTLLNAPAQPDFVVVEMGANHQGEIDLLSRIAEPTHGYITNIGLAHLEGFGGEEGVYRGKKSSSITSLRMEARRLCKKPNPKWRAQAKGLKMCGCANPILDMDTKTRRRWCCGIPWSGHFHGT